MYYQTANAVYSAITVVSRTALIKDFRSYHPSGIYEHPLTKINWNFHKVENDLTDSTKAKALGQNTNKQLTKFKSSNDETKDGK